MRRDVLLLTSVFLSFLLAGCNGGDSSGQNNDNDTHDSDGPNGEQTGTDYPRSIVHLSIENSCPGCNEISVCNHVPKSEKLNGVFAPVLRNRVPFYTSQSRMMAAGQSVPLETCRHLSIKELRDISFSNDSLNAQLNAGAITLESESSNWAALPLSSNYETITSTYVEVVPTAAGMANYEAGKPILLKAAGGSDVAAFEATATTPEPLLLLSPETTDRGKIKNIDTLAALSVSWSGGNAPTVLIVLSSSWCTGVHHAVMCRVTNDGEFIIPESVVKAVEFARFGSISLWDNTEIPLSVPEIGDDDVYWTIGTGSSIPIFHDPDAEPTLPVGCGPMAMGHVGAACEKETDCLSGCCLSDFNYLGEGYCSIPGCESEDECPSDAKCFNETNPLMTYITSFCAKKCSSDADCRVSDNHICHTVHNVCVPDVK